MKQDLLNQAKNRIYEKKMIAKNEFEKIMQPLYENEEFSKCEKKLTQIVIENAKKESENKLSDKKTENELRQKLKDIKSKFGVTQDKPNYSCKKCEDEGFVNGQICECLKREMSHILLEASGFDNLVSFQEATKTAGELLPIFQKMQQWCNAKSTKNLIYIAGPTGVGKTYLLKSMANEFIEHGKVVKIITAFKMNQDFKDFSKTHNEDNLNKYLTPEILFVDDLGTEPLYKNVTIEFLYLVVNERKMKNLPTIITSNLMLNDIFDRYDERIYSRIVDKNSSIAIFMNGNDRRVK